MRSYCDCSRHRHITYLRNSVEAVNANFRHGHTSSLVFFVQCNTCVGLYEAVILKMAHQKIFDINFMSGVLARMEAIHSCGAGVTAPDTPRPEELYCNLFFTFLIGWNSENAKELKADFSNSVSEFHLLITLGARILYIKVVLV